MTAVRAGIAALIYSKTTNLSITAIDKASSVTIMSADVERIVIGLRSIHDIWANFIQVAISAWLLELQTGVAVVAPLAVATACALGTMKISAGAGKQQMEWMKRIEKRIGKVYN
jgi:ATP-binding cassette subfamily C (CFTR/MRP) protein 1